MTINRVTISPDMTRVKPAMKWAGVKRRLAAEKRRTRNRSRKSVNYIKQKASGSLEIAPGKKGAGSEAEGKVLRENDGHYREFFFNNYAVMLMIDPLTGEIVNANSAACGYYGYSEEALTRMKITDINVLPTDHVYSKMEVAQSGRGLHFFFRHRLADGQVRDVEVFSGPITFGGRKLLFSIIHDITERKKAEEALRQSEERNRRLIETASEGIWQFDTDFRTIDVNERMAGMLGYSREGVIGRNPGMFLANETIAEIRRQGAESPVKNTAAHEHRLRTKEGSTRWAMVSASALRDANGCVSGFFAMFTDITERRRMEQNLRESEALYRTIARNFPDGAIYIFDHDLRFRVADGQALSHLGFSRESLEGKTIWESTDEDICRLFEQRFPRVLAGESLHFETAIRGRVFSSNYLPIYDDQGNVIVGMVVSHDITKRKRAEDALQQLNESLERRVAERTELAEARARKLRALTAELIEAEEKERRRIAELLHDDLQQVLVGARMQLLAASHRLPDFPQLERVDMLLNESIEKSRRLSHELSPVVVYYSGLHAALKWLAQQMKEKFNLEVRVEGDEPPAFSDELKIFVFRAVQELLFNITKHAGVSRARVVFSFSGNHFNIAVSDPGKGFDTEALDTADTGSKGIGLLSLKERLQTMGGSLDIRSIPGQGSCFSMSIPVQGSIPLY